jgi:hypothetical protein
MRERGVRGVMLGRVNDAIAALGCWDMLEGGWEGDCFVSLGLSLPIGQKIYQQLWTPAAKVIV